MSQNSTPQTYPDIVEIAKLHSGVLRVIETTKENIVSRTTSSIN